MRLGERSGRRVSLLVRLLAARPSEMLVLVYLLNVRSAWARCRRHVKSWPWPARAEAPVDSDSRACTVSMYSSLVLSGRLVLLP